jgi:hypothetical protein
MIRCSSYDECRFLLINLLSSEDSYLIKSTEIFFDEDTNGFFVDFEKFDEEECNKILN